MALSKYLIGLERIVHSTCLYFLLIKKIFDLKGGPADYTTRMKTASIFRATIEDLFNTVTKANETLQIMLPDDKKAEMNELVTEIKTRMEILKKTDDRLEFIDDFNKRLNVFDQGLIDMDNWLQVMIIRTSHWSILLLLASHWSGWSQEA